LQMYKYRRSYNMPAKIRMRLVKTPNNPK
jgi:hypothetical protein